MKIGIAIAFSLFLTSNNIVNTSEYDVKDFYKSFEPDSGTKVLTSNGDLEEAEYILSPTKINAGKYKLTVTRKAKDLYKVDGQNIFIETRYCYEYATQEEVILIVEGSYGYSKGKIIF